MLASSHGSPLLRSQVFKVVISCYKGRRHDPGPTVTAEEAVAALKHFKVRGWCTACLSCPELLHCTAALLSHCIFSPLRHSVQLLYTLD